MGLATRTWQGPLPWPAVGERGPWAGTFGPLPVLHVTRGSE